MYVYIYIYVHVVCVYLLQEFVLQTLRCIVSNLTVQACDWKIALAPKSRIQRIQNKTLSDSGKPLRSEPYTAITAFDAV